MCGIFAAWNVRKAAELVVIGLHGNQHRAIDYAGIASSDGTHIYRERGAGLTRQVFTKDMLDRLHGQVALGHIRYPTVADDKTRDNIQPLVGTYNGHEFALAHNGNLTNIEELKTFVAKPLATSMDTEYIVRLIEASSGTSLESDLVRICRQLAGSFSFVIVTGDKLVVVRDPTGNRPLSIAKRNGSYFVSSETCVFPNLDARDWSDVAPGTIVSIENGEMSTTRFAPSSEKKCRFEGIYYSHPASVVFGERVGAFRVALGQALEKHCPAEGGADIVTPIPDSANFIAMGYGQSGRSGTFYPVISRSHYVGRTFIAATQAKRDQEVAQKFTFSAEEIAGKRIVVVDDSIVRGTTLPKIVNQLRSLGAKSVHIRIGSPPIVYSCKYGINTPTREELISSHVSAYDLCKAVGADSLAFLPLEVLKSLSPAPQKYCFACMDGNYW